LRFPWTTLGVSLGAVVVGYLLFTGLPNPPTELWTRMVDSKAPKSKEPPLVPGIKTGLMPAMDEGSFVLDYWAPAGSPLAETEKKTKKIEEVLAKHPDVQSWVRRTGAENGLFATQTSRGDFQVVLRPAQDDLISLVRLPVRPPLNDLEKILKAEGKSVETAKAEIQSRYRRRPLPKVMDEIRDQVGDLYSEHQLKVETIQVMADELGDLSGSGKPIEVKIFGPDQEVLRKLADDVGDILEKKGAGHGISEPNSNVREGNPDLIIRPKYVEGDKHAVKPDAISRQLRAIYQGQIATRIPEASVRITDVRVRYPDSIRFGIPKENPGQGAFDRQRLLDQWILLPDTKTAARPIAPGALAGPLDGPFRAAPLYALADVKPKRTPDEQWRENQQPAIFVTAELNEEEAGLGAVVADVESWMKTDVHFPAGYHAEIGGHYLKQKEAFSSLLSVMVVAILLVYVMLAFQFQSLVLPLLIFLTQPLSLVSGLFALWLTDTPLDVSSYMGAILLIGLDMKNGILLVETIQHHRRAGMPLQAALMLAGHTRFRPILMTSLAAIMGLFPLALGIGPGSQMQQPLAIMVIGGLTANMLFTRMVIPAGYLVWERLSTPRQTVSSIE
jgi:multidrug efflux pump subunit AcrB